MNKLIKTIISDHQNFTFNGGDAFVWSPTNQSIGFDESSIGNMQGIWSLLHEVGHASLDHKKYSDDLELLMMEVAAWKEASIIAEKYGIKIESAYIEGSLDSYREWLHKRSRCIDCGTHSMQLNSTTYQCHNCQTRWKVPVSRMCHIRKKRV